MLTPWAHKQDEEQGDVTHQHRHRHSHHRPPHRANHRDSGENHEQQLDQRKRLPQLFSSFHKSVGY